MLGRSYGAGVRGSLILLLLLGASFYLSEKTLTILNDGLGLLDMLTNLYQVGSDSCENGLGIVIGAFFDALSVLVGFLSDALGFGESFTTHLLYL